MGAEEVLTGRCNLESVNRGVRRAGRKSEKNPPPPREEKIVLVEVQTEGK